MHIDDDPDPKGDADRVEPTTETNVLIAYHTSARAELIQRIQQRDQALVLFVGVVGVLFTAAIANFHARYALLFAVPYLGLGASFIAMQHNSVIGALGRYCGITLATDLHRVEGAHQWDESPPLRMIGKTAFGHRLRGHLLLLIGPQVAATGLGMYGLFRWIDGIKVSHGLAVVAALVGTVVPATYSALIVVSSDRVRRRLSPFTETPAE